LKSVSGAIASLLSIGWIIGGILVFGYTIIVSYAVYGFFGAIVAFFTPVLSQLFWMYHFSIEYGFLNTYNIAIFVLLAMKIVSMLAFGRVSSKQNVTY
jgi:hypothetical protein